MKLRCAFGFTLADSAARAASRSATSASFPASCLGAGGVRSLLSGVLFQLVLGLADLRQPRFPPGHLALEVPATVVGTVPRVLVGVDAFGLGHHRLDLGFEILLRRTHPVITHRLVSGGVRFDLGAIQGHPAHLHHAHLLAQGQCLHKQGLQRGQVPAPEAGDGPEVRGAVRREVPECDVLVAAGFDLAGRADPARVAVEQQLEHQLWVIRRETPGLGIGRQKRCQVQDLVDQFADKQRQMIIRKPVPQRRRHQERLILVIDPERLVHRDLRTRRHPRRHPRWSLEQLILGRHRIHTHSLADPPPRREPETPTTCRY